MNIFENLPLIQQKYINKPLFFRCVDYVQNHKFDGKIEKYISRDLDPDNARRYCILVMRYDRK